MTTKKKIAASVGAVSLAAVIAPVSYTHLDVYKRQDQSALV